MNKPITILHLADIHLGVDNYGYTNPATGLSTRLEDFSHSLEQAVNHAISLPVDVALFCGDAYKRNSPSPTEQRELVRHFCALADAGIPVVMISGNHDIPVMHGKAASIDIFRRIRPGMFHVFVNQPTLGGAYPEPPMIQTQKGPLAVCCLPFISPSFLRNIPQLQNLQGDEQRNEFEKFFNDIIFAMPEGIPDDIPRVLLAHLTVHGSTVGGYKGITLLSDEIQILPSMLANAGYDYIALGHIHRHQDLTTRREIPVVYPGSIDRVDFGEADEDKGFIVAQVARGGSEYEFIPLKVREFVDIRVEEDAPGDDLTDRILRAIEKEDVHRAVVRVSYAADDQEIQTLDLKSLHEALKSAHYKIGFLRIPKQREARRRGATLSTEIQLADALTAFIREHEELKDESDILLERAKEIDQTVRKQG